MTTARKKYVKIFERFITQVWMYAMAIRILSKSYLPISLLQPSKLQKVLGKIKKAIQTTNQDYYIVIKRLHLYCYLKLVTFGIDENRNLIVQFQVFVQPYTQQPLILYQIEAVPVPIIDQNKHANSYTHLQIDRPYIALNSETFISLRKQKLRTGKTNSYEFYLWKNFFIVKHKSNYSCVSVIYFNLDPEIIKENCSFAYYFSIIDIKPTVLDGRNEITLANCLDDKHMVYNVNTDIPIKIPS